TLRKARAGVSIQLAALAKGYGVDAVAEALADLGWTDFMVEIGGDLRAEGRNARGEAWRIGIERPMAHARTVQEVIALSGQGMATSGDYRNYFEADGTRYAHVLDAKTGRPVDHGTVSVTVLAEDAVHADAWATALLALGVDRGLEIAERWHLAAMFISRGEQDAERFDIVVSERFAQVRGAQAH
ncbi:MAG: FAD:protein FMN transferase, partial [Pseudomonadota bacterium]